jgi:hypothetical protein
LFGEPWLQQTYNYIQEDKTYFFTSLLNLMPLARTPLSRESGNALGKWRDTLEKSFAELTPNHRKRNALQGRVKSGEVVVIADAFERKHPMFTGVDITEG